MEVRIWCPAGWTLGSQGRRSIFRLYRGDGMVNGGRRTTGLAVRVGQKSDSTSGAHFCHLGRDLLLQGGPCVVHLTPQHLPLQLHLHLQGGGSGAGQRGLRTK